MLLRALLLSVIFVPLGFAQAAPVAPSTTVNSDRSITFRYLDATATAVSVTLDGFPKPFAMTKDADGLWSVTSPVLAPQIYSYYYMQNGQYRIDPSNRWITANPVGPFYQTIVVPGDGPLPWDDGAVPHGELHQHFFTTKVVLGLHNDQDSYMVYTPPGYDARVKKKYPVLYLLHGFTQAAEGWSAAFQANLVLDNLIAQGKAKPMIVVMPLGYGDMAVVLPTAGRRDPGASARSIALFSQSLLTEIIPQVEAEYNVKKDRDGRAIAGLSMGGQEALSVGLNHTNQFAWIGGFSAGLGRGDFSKDYPVLTPKTADLKLIWIACGTEDNLITPNRRLVAYLKGENLPVVGVETPGYHQSQVWRDNLVHFAPLLFRDGK